MISCRKADLSVEEDGDLMVRLLNEYASDPMGGGEELSEYAKNNLVKGKHDHFKLT